jgi:hypothetical protein
LSRAASDQRADLAGRAAAVGSLQEALLVGLAEEPPATRRRAIGGEDFAADAGASTVVALRAPSDAPASARALVSFLVSLTNRSIVMVYLVAH